MNVWICLLRGINVGGHKAMKMADVREFFERELGVPVHTYIQSGNILFRSKGSAGKLTRQLASLIEKEWGFEVPVMMRTLDEWNQIIAKSPFARIKQDELTLAHAILLNQPVSTKELEELCKTESGSDKVDGDKTTLWLWTPDGYRNTRFSNTLIERKLGSPVTARNWKTVLKLQELASAL